MVKTSMFRLPLALVLSAFVSTAFAAGGGNYESADIDPGNVNSLQRGARNFMNYCSGCHSAKYVRYNTIGGDLNLSEDELINNLMFNAEKTFETINVAMRPDEAERWFGVAPPDLTLIGRSRGADYIYSFLKGFYIDPERATGVNNTVLAGTSMPHVLGGLQGYQRAVYEMHEEADGSQTEHMAGLELAVPGTMDEEAYDEFVRDTTNFLVYIAEPIRAERRQLGVWVLMYLLFFLIIARMLKKQIWKDVK